MLRKGLGSTLQQEALTKTPSGNLASAPTLNSVSAGAGPKIIKSKGFEPLGQLLYTEAAAPDMMCSIPTLNFAFLKFIQ